MKDTLKRLKETIKTDMAEGREKRIEVNHLKAEGKGPDAHTINENWSWDRDRRRINHLAYCYAKGRTYNQCEPTVRKLPAWSLRHRTSSTIAGMAKLIHADKELMEEEKTRIRSWIDLKNVTRWNLLGETPEVARKEMLHACVAHHENEAAAAKAELERSQKSAAKLREKLERDYALTS